MPQFVPLVIRRYSLEPYAYILPISDTVFLMLPRAEKSSSGNEEGRHQGADHAHPVPGRCVHCTLRSSVLDIAKQDSVHLYL